ncbi:hypothetical protein Pelo_19471 [Pelomyxa schiedti]|nr:hypothetical protein Pelo_19471 [Pelomyxa schiedti]
MSHNTMGNSTAAPTQQQPPSPSTSDAAPATTTTTNPPPPPWSPPRVTLDVVISAADQFVAFACGSIVSRTRAQSPARLLAASPSMVEQCGREWVVRGCRDVVFTLIRNERLFEEYLEVHVWMELSPTLGVVACWVRGATSHGEEDTTGKGKSHGNWQGKAADDEDEEQWRAD